MLIIGTLILPRDEILTLSLRNVKSDKKNIEQFLGSAKSDDCFHY